MVSHTVFRIEAGATLLGATLYDAYPYEWFPGVVNTDPTMPRVSPGAKKRQALIAGAVCVREAGDGSDCEQYGALVNVTIDGGGVIDGQGQAWWWAKDAGSPAASERPDMVQPVLVDGLVIRDVTLRRSPNWSLHPTLCNDVRIAGIRIESGQFDDAPEYSGHNVDGCDPDSCTNLVLEDSVISAGDDCVAIYSVHGPTANITVRNVTCHTPLSITHGAGGTSNVTFENCTVRGDWGGDHTYKPQWWKTALRLKSDRHTNGTLERIQYRGIRAVGVDLLFDIQMWYPCQNQSGMHNYRLCREFYPVQPSVRPHIRDVSLVDVVGHDAWRSVWLNCLPESPCENITFAGVRVGPDTLPPVCEHVRGGAGAGAGAIAGCFAQRA